MYLNELKLIKFPLSCVDFVAGSSAAQMLSVSWCLSTTVGRPKRVEKIQNCARKWEKLWIIYLLAQQIFLQKYQHEI